MSEDTFVKKGHYKVDATIRFDNSVAEVTQALSQRLDHVVGMVLYEYSIKDANLTNHVGAVTATTASTATSFVVTCDNDFLIGETVTFSGFAGGLAALNGVSGTIIAQSAVGFTVLSTANPGVVVDAGTATVARGDTTNSVWKLNFPDLIATSHISNFGQGHPVAVTDGSLTHVKYDTPRVISVANKGWIGSLRMQLVGDGGLATFTNATFWMSFICKDPKWQGPAAIAASQRDEPGYLQQFTWGRVEQLL